MIVDFKSASRSTLGVFIGRFQFFHNGHLSAIQQALEKVDYLVVLTGSANKPRTYFNPFTAEERATTIVAALPPALEHRVVVLPLDDFTYNDTAWILAVHEAAGEALEYFALPANTDVALVGLRKDGTSYYLNMFPRWGEVTVEDSTGLSATPLRERYFTLCLVDEGSLPPATTAFLKNFKKSDDYVTLCGEYGFVQEYRSGFKSAKFAPYFVTVDACVVQSGYVLLVKRRAMPGKGLWALPGGFLDQSSRIEDWIYAELEQETKIAVPEAVLRGRTRTIRVYDDVHRSSRGRTVTHCALIVLEASRRKDGDRVRLPKVRGADDAERAKWFPLSGPGAIDPRKMFEDHHSIVADLTAGL